MKVKLIDGMFSHEEDPGRLGPGGQGTPAISWERGEVDSKSCFVTDHDIINMTTVPDHKYKVAFVLENREIVSEAVSSLLNDNTRFDYILTHDEQLLKKENALPYPTIQYHVSDFSPPNKERMVSMVSSNKNWASGHAVRHEIIRKYNGRFDLYGRGFNPIENKEDGLRPYLFSIAVENSKSDWYFTEKILDCFASHTVPIYWGCPNIGDFFNSDGIITINSADDLDDVLNNLSVDDYMGMLSAVQENYNLVCTKYSSCEQWLYDTYRFLFEDSVNV